MNIAREILNNANINIEDTDLYKSIHQNIPNLLDGLSMLIDDTENEEGINITKVSLENICNALDKSGFTYFPQKSNLNKKVLPEVFKNYVEFYEGYKDNFEADQLEILNTNSKDLLYIIETLK